MFSNAKQPNIVVLGNFHGERALVHVNFILFVHIFQALLRIMRLSIKKSVSCPAGVQNCGQSGDHFFFLKERVGKYCPPLEKKVFFMDSLNMLW